jgi:hypothetical protein
VFVLAAVVAITLYMELPRVAFESQRTKEQLLIDRGNQYKRAIQLFYRKNKRFPTTMDELEKFQEVRYLRQKYKDPMTGKAEWRIIHVGPGGQLTDSLVTKQQNPLGQNGSSGQNGSNNGQQGSNGQSGSGQANPGFGSFGSQSSGSSDQSAPTQYNANGIAISGPDADTSGGPPSGINMATARRPSDSMNLTGAGPAQAVNPLDPNLPPDPSQPPVQATPDPNQQQNTSQQNSGQQNLGQAQPGQQYQNPGNIGFQPANGGNPNPGTNASNPGVNPSGANPSGANPGGANPALNAIQNSLFTPRPLGASGFGSGFGSSNSTTGNAPSGGAVGIAGVATKYKGPSIKVVNERKKYQEWEFIYDMKKDKSLMGAAGVQQLQNAQNPAQGQNAPGFSNFGGSQSSSGSGFGSGSSSQSQSQPQQQQPQQQQ